MVEKIKAIESGTLYHIAIAVKDLKKSEKLYEDIIGLKVTHREKIEEQGVIVSMLEPDSGKGTSIELLEPIDENSPISKFLQNRGEGIHHICFYVNNLQETLNRLKNEGVKLIDEEPRTGAYNSKVAFIHPKAMNGVLIELAEII